MHDPDDQQYDVTNDSGDVAGLLEVPSPKAWMARILWAAGFYNICWGIAVVCWPGKILKLLGMASMSYPEVWQYVGVLTGVYGIAYLLVAVSPLQNWPIIFIGLVTKLMGPVGFVYSARQGHLPWQFGWTVLGNDVIWWVPFGIILWRAYQYHVISYRTKSPEVQEFALRVRTNEGLSLLEMSKRKPLMLVFLRHLGCPFCRNLMNDLSKQRRLLESSDTSLVLVHMSTDEQAERILSRFGLADLPRISDRRRALYRAFGLQMGSLWQVFGPQLWLRALQYISRFGQNPMPEGGNVFQLPGVFLIYHGHVAHSFLYHDIGNKPNFNLLANKGGISYPETAS